MKFWQKIFLYSVTLFVVLLSGTGALLVEKAFGENLQSTITRAINKYVDMEYTIYLNADYLLDIEDSESVKNWLEIVIKGYATNAHMEPVSVEVYNADNQLIMSNSKLKVMGERPEITQTTANEKTFIIREIEGKKYVFIGSMINLNNTDFKLILSKDISSAYIQRQEDYHFLLMIGIGVTGVLAIGMYIISKRLTQPIVALSMVTKEVAKGNYSKRVTEHKNNDEVGILEENFNMMINEIENNIKALEDLSEAKQRFIDSLNHEIKTPITSIIGYSELLLKSKVSESTKVKALNYIHSEARRLELLNTTLLQLILVRGGQEEKQNVSLNACFVEVEKALKYQLEQRNICLKVNLLEEFVYANFNQLQILFINLLDNSIKASDEASEILVKGWPDYENQYYILTIQDFGIGIGEEDLDKIMEPFYMVDKARTRKYNGIGLGLAICKEICQSNQIELKIESAKDQGTKVTLYFQMKG